MFFLPLTWTLLSLEADNLYSHFVAENGENVLELSRILTYEKNNTKKEEKT